MDSCGQATHHWWPWSSEAFAVDEIPTFLDPQLGQSRQSHLNQTEDTHTTHPFNGPLSRPTQVSRYQKRKTNMDFTEARDSEWQWHQLGHMQVCTSLQTDDHASTPPLSFLQAGCPSCHPTNSVNALKASNQTEELWKKWTVQMRQKASCWEGRGGIRRGWNPLTNDNPSPLLM